MREFLLFVTVVLSSCNIDSNCLNQRAFLKCIKCKFNSYSDNVNYDFEKTSAAIDKFLKLQGVINSDGRSDYLKVFAEGLHRNINYNEFVLEVDDTFLGSPGFWTNYIYCSEKNKSAKWNSLCQVFPDNIEKLKSDNSYREEVLKMISDDQFSQSEIKILFQVLIYEDLAYQSDK